MRFFGPCLTLLLAALTGPLPAALPAESEWARLAPHPRLFANAARFEELKTPADDVARQLVALLKQQADEMLVRGPIDYPATGFLMGPARDAQGRILALALSYRLTGDKRFFTRAREELLRLAALPEWRPTQFLDVGEAALAAGIGLDWLYDDLSPDDRDQITRAIVENAIKPSLAVKAGNGSWVDGDFNWTQVCHGGVIVAALAIAEREPVLARQVVERAVANMGNVGATYSPDGSYAEGPSYWSYGTSFHVILIEALKSALGTSCDLEKFPGFLKTGDFNNQMVAPTGEEFNFSDYHKESLNEPIMLWFARELRDRGVARDELAALGVPGKIKVVSRHLPLELLWWDPSLPAAKDTRSRHWTAAGVLPLAVMRSAWDDPTAAFVAVKGGTPNHSHAHTDVGSFILETDGVRWALDLGTESYGNMRAAKLDLWNYTQDSSRWTTFRVGPEGHNILRFDGARQDVSGKAEIRVLPDDNGTLGNVVDLTSLYRNQVAKAERTVKLHPDKSITIADEWTTANHPVSASFQWLTKAKISRTRSGLRLEQSGKLLWLRVEPFGAKIDVEDVSAARATQDSPNPGLSRIVIHVPTPARTTARLLITATPL